APRAPQLPDPGDRAVDAATGGGDPDRRRPGIPWIGRPAAHPGVGNDAWRGTDLPAVLLVHRHVSGSGHLSRGHGVQPGRRRSARRARSTGRSILEDEEARSMRWYVIGLALVVLAGRVCAGRSPRAGECRPRAGDIHRDGLHAHRWRAVHPPVADAGAGRERRVWSLADRLLDARGGATPAFQIDRFTIRTLCLST